MVSWLAGLLKARAPLSTIGKPKSGGINVWKKMGRHGPPLEPPYGCHVDPAHRALSRE